MKYKRGDIIEVVDGRNFLVSEVNRDLYLCYNMSGNGVAKWKLKEKWVTRKIGEIPNHSWLEKENPLKSIFVKQENNVWMAQFEGQEEVIGATMEEAVGKLIISQGKQVGIKIIS